MSRIGRKHIDLPANVTVSVSNDNLVTVSGPLGTLSRPIDKTLTVQVEGNIVTVARSAEEKRDRELHGLSRQLIANMVEGVSKGFEKKLNINGVGYKAVQQGKDLVLSIGFSHPVEIKAIDGITLSCEKTTLSVKGINKELVGQFAANIRAIKPVEPYHAYGITYVDEVVIRKATNKAAKK